jgi:PAS domain S-box-containing protein
MKFFSKPSVKLSLIYFIFSFLWILTSDNILAFFIRDFDIYSTMQTFKGWFFILITSLLIYFNADKFFNKEKQLTQEIENIFYNSATPIALANEDGTILKINNTWKELLGYELEEMDTLDKLSKKISQNQSKDFYNSITSDFSIDKKIHIGVFPISTKENNILLWNFDISSMGIINKKKTIILTIVDITELRKKELMIIQQSKMATMGEMIGNITHQWKQPLSIISSSNGLLKMNQEFHNISQDKINLALEGIGFAVENLNETIEDFSNFFNPNKKKELFYLERTFEKTFNLINSQFKHNNIKLIQDIQDIQYFGFENELLQTLINLIKNSKDELIKKDSNATKLIFIRVYQEEMNIYIKIKDNANGINEEYIDKVFDQYFTTKEHEKGSGLGLYMSKQIIENHMNGKIEVKNVNYVYEGEEFNGAEFSIIFPTES